MGSRPFPAGRLREDDEPGGPETMPRAGGTRNPEAARRGPRTPTLSGRRRSRLVILCASRRASGTAVRPRTRFPLPPERRLVPRRAWTPRRSRPSRRRRSRCRRLRTPARSRAGAAATSCSPVTRMGAPGSAGSARAASWSSCGPSRAAELERPQSTGRTRACPTLALRADDHPRSQPPVLTTAPVRRMQTAGERARTGRKGSLSARNPSARCASGVVGG